MDRFLNSNANKRSRSDSDEVTPASKKPRSCSKQGNVPASVRVAEFGKKLFYEDSGKLFCRPCNLVVDHYRGATPSGKLCGLRFSISSSSTLSGMDLHRLTVRRV